MKTSRMTIKGQVTVPKELRDLFGWRPHTELQFERMADGVKITLSKKERTRGDKIVGKLRGSGNRRMSTDEIMALTRGDQ